MRILTGSTYVFSPQEDPNLISKKDAEDFGNSGSIFPGMIVQFSGTTVPNGWLICDGNQISRNLYSKLFNAIGTLHGSGNGSTTFHIPDLRRRIPLGKGTSDTVGQNDGLAEGSRSFTHTHSVPAHYHAMGTGADLNITSSGGTTSSSNATGISLNSTNIDHTHPLAGSGATTNSTGSHSHTVSDPTHVHDQSTVANQPGGSAVRHTYRFDSSNLTAYPIGVTTYSATTGVGIVSGGAHTHTMTGSSQTMASSTTHNHGITDPNHSHSIPSHTHGSGNFSGRIGNVSSTIDGNAGMNSGSINNTNYYVIHHLIKV